MAASSSNDLKHTSPYIQEYFAAIDRCERFGLHVPFRYLVQKPCIDMSVIGPILHEFYEEHSPDDLIGRSLATHFVLMPRLYEKTRIPFALTIGWMAHHGSALFPHDEEFIGRYLSGRNDRAWFHEDCPFHLWFTSPACEILDVTIAMNVGHRHTREQFLRRVIYQSGYASTEEFVYHPTLVGPDFFYKTGLSEKHW